MEMGLNRISEVVALNKALCSNKDFYNPQYTLENLEQYLKDALKLLETVVNCKSEFKIASEGLGKISIKECIENYQYNCIMLRACIDDIITILIQDVLDGESDVI